MGAYEGERYPARMRNSPAWTLVGCALLSIGVAAGPAEQTVDFTRQVRPILSDRCFICHGPDEQAREAELRLDFRAAAVESGAIVPGEPEASAMIERLRHPKTRKRMPPPHSNLTVSDGEIELLERWIREGAEYREHWAFVAPQAVDTPAVSDRSWPRDELDRFVLAKLEAQGREPSPEADRATWLRRVSFVLHGLPPTLTELDDFTSDASPRAHERVLDRLLASPRFGERFASEWLDVARYADSYGYQNDATSRVWPWRDWVVRAFNEDLPWKDFVTWQVAGDLLPDATREQRLATSFNRLHRQTNEGGSVEEEFRVEYVADRVHTFGTAFLGLTFECARCHDHKYDPISQREYYELFAYFDDIDESGLYSHFTPAVPTPTLALPSAEQEMELASLAATRSQAEAQHLEQVQATDSDFASWFEQSPRELQVFERHLFDFETLSEGKWSSQSGESSGKAGGGLQPAEGRHGQGLTFSGEDNVSFGSLGSFSRSDPFTIALWLQTPEVKERAVVFHRSRAWTDAGSQGYELLIEEGRLSGALIHFWPGDAIRVRAKDPLPVSEWVHVALRYDGSSRASGLELVVNGEVAPVEIVRDRLTRGIRGGGDLQLTLGQRFRDRGFQGGRIDDFCVIGRRASLMELRWLMQPQSADEAERLQSMKTWSASRTNSASAELREHHRLTAADLLASAEVLRSARRAFDDATDRVPQIMVMEELPRERQTFVLARGSYQEAQDAVSPNTPSCLPRDPQSPPRNRLELARWLTNDSNPLFARVSVNRLWQWTFGQGLVSTPENFGNQGELPLQAELLDYLALEWQRSGASSKSFLKRLLLSATFRQDSRASEEARAWDPHNRYLGRGPRRSLNAEMTRDNALYLSGLLVEQLGGPPVKPYQPPGLWLEKSGNRYQADSGPGLWRRSLYSFWKRTSPPPSMMIFDASKRDVCVVQRQATSSPMQVLALWNDPQQVEAARVLAARILREVAGKDESAPNSTAVLVQLYRRCTSRVPDEQELQWLGGLLNTARVAFETDPEGRDAWLSIGEAPLDEKADRDEVAALAVLANTLLGFDGTLTLR